MISDYRKDGTIDTRDLEEHLKDLKNKKYSDEDLDDKDYIEEIERIKTEIGEEEFKFGITLIEEDEFFDYAKEYAYDIGLLSGSLYGKGQGNPIDFYVDWDEWAENLKNDYEEIEFNDRNYFYR